MSTRDLSYCWKAKFCTNRTLRYFRNRCRCSATSGQRVKARVILCRNRDKKSPILSTADCKSQGRDRPLSRNLILTTRVGLSVHEVMYDRPGKHVVSSMMTSRQGLGFQIWTEKNITRSNKQKVVERDGVQHSRNSCPLRTLYSTQCLL